MISHRLVYSKVSKNSFKVVINNLKVIYGTSILDVFDKASKFIYTKHGIRKV